MRIKYSFTVDVDPYKVWELADEKLAACAGLTQEEKDDWIGTAQEPDVPACLFELFDPDNLKLPGVSYVSRDSDVINT